MDEAKRAAGTAAAALVEPGMRLGLGTGSTVAHLLDALAARRVADIAGIPTSRATEERCRELGIALLSPEDVAELDLAIDGADEFDASFQVTKGGGGALLREKVVATMARRFVVVATPDKEVERLGRSFPLPVEIVPFARGPVRRALEARGASVVLRRDASGPVLTDNGNEILDATFPAGIEDPAVLDLVLAAEPGVVTSGLFIDLVDEVILGAPDGTTVHRRTPETPAD
ncbi:MAG: ribose-5-phosphate isomerase RpiA [Nitriliruptoraceae bacterium]|nr:ribose-5-phosphate isomerase RpiA [Nitriliruptoraceae bacterium]